jgi:hypothetical protein
VRLHAAGLGLVLILAACHAGGVATAGTVDPTAPPGLKLFTFAPQPLHVGDSGTFRFVTSRAGAATIALDRQVAGRRVAGRCVAPAGAPDGAPACLRAIASGRLRFSVDAGEGLRRFDGRIAGRRLIAGRYRATLRVVNAEVGSSAPAYVTVRIAAK